MGSPGLRALALLRHWGTLETAAGRSARLPGVTRGSLSVPMPGSTSQLEGVSCTSSSNCWAVGDYSSGGTELNQALHWNGSKWSLVTTPQPGGTASGGFSKLFGVRCNSSSDCWAVGDYRTSSAELTQALHWNGSKWSVVTTPSPGGSSTGDFSVIFDVWCTSASNCWAAGDYGNLSGTETILNLALHWNGTTWSQATTPNPEGTSANDANALESVRCTSASNCWAVGTYGFVGGPITLLNEALHWNGSSWSLISTPNPGGTGGTDVNFMSGLACSMASSCWGVGSYGSETSTTTTLLNEALHWDGAQWSLVATPDPDGTGTGANNQLISATCTSASNCWAVGSYGSFNGGTGIILNEGLHWNGTKWSLVSTPDPGGTANLDSNTLRAVHCTSASNCWAVGDAQKNGANDVNQALRWNGSKWSTG